MPAPTQSPPAKQWHQNPTTIFCLLGTYMERKSGASNGLDPRYAFWTTYPSMPWYTAGQSSVGHGNGQPISPPQQAFSVPMQVFVTDSPAFAQTFAPSATPFPSQPQSMPQGTTHNARSVRGTGPLPFSDNSQPEGHAAGGASGGLVVPSQSRRQPTQPLALPITLVVNLERAIEDALNVFNDCLQQHEGEVDRTKHYLDEATRNDHWQQMLEARFKEKPLDRHLFDTIYAALNAIAQEAKDTAVQIEAMEHSRAPGKRVSNREIVDEMCMLVERCNLIGRRHDSATSEYWGCKSMVTQMLRLKQTCEFAKKSISGEEN